MPKKLITKHISDLTDEDKVQYLAYMKESFDVNYGWDWDSLVPQIMEKIDYIFSHDDETDPDSASISMRAYFRKYSKQQQGKKHQDQSRSPQQHQGQEQSRHVQKPSLADFLIFGSAFQKGVDEASWWADVNDATDSQNSVIASVSASSSTANNVESGKGQYGRNSKESQGSRGKKGSSLLSPADKDLFYNTYFSLIDYVNRKYGIIKSINVLEEQDSIDPEQLNAIASKLWANPKKEIDEYLENMASTGSTGSVTGSTGSVSAATGRKNNKSRGDNSRDDGVGGSMTGNEEAVLLLESWKRRVRGYFMIERYLKDGTIFISVRDGDSDDTECTYYGVIGYNSGSMRDGGHHDGDSRVGHVRDTVGEVYLVKGLSMGYEAMFKGETLPLLVEATLLPFKNVIITDGLVAPYWLVGNGKMKSAFKDVYMTAKNKGKIRKTL